MINNKKTCVYGEKEIRKGPKVFSLYPGETDDGVQNAKILIKNEGAIIQSIYDYKDKKAGQKWLIEGPTLYYPSKYEKLVDTITAQNISQGEAIYIRNTTNSELKLITGPISYLRGVDEELFYKKLTQSEYEALSIQGIKAEPTFKAYNIQVQKNEIICIVDYKKK